MSGRPISYQDMLDGDPLVWATSMPKRDHVASVIASRIGMPFQFARGGPGGWRIMCESKLSAFHTADMAGWRRERMSDTRPTQCGETVPDWVCEILSPHTARAVRLKKMQAYANIGVRYLWIVDPIIRTLESYSLQNGHWTVLSTYGDERDAKIAPFEAVPLPLAELWLPEEKDPSA